MRGFFAPSTLLLMRASTTSHHYRRYVAVMLKTSRTAAHSIAVPQSRLGEGCRVNSQNDVPDRIKSVSQNDVPDRIKSVH